jgi:aminoglycoside phosphotransferase family enzyme/predicted kinase
VQVGVQGGVHRQILGGQEKRSLVADESPAVCNRKKQQNSWAALSIVYESGIMTHMDVSLPPLIQALLDPARYSGEVTQVDLVQTHISWVLLAGEFAFKIKKPVKLSFLDFSTLALRHQYCLDELRLNRRFAPDLYLDVVGIYGTEQDPQWQGSGVPIDYAVKMCRFDEAARLDHVCARGELRASHLSDLADVVVAFHQAAALAPAVSCFGAGPQILQPALDNFAELQRGVPAAHLQTRLATLRRWTQEQFEALAPVMQERQRAGCVRECHGDLHLANMVLIHGQVQLFDCIEFNAELRWIDVASEIAFVFVDLMAHGQPGLASWFINETLSRSGDYESALVLRFYAVYRAMVRAKVAGLRWMQTQGELTEVQTYVALAERLVTVPPVRLLITHGLSGCGKTVVSNAWLQADTHAATLRLRSDVQRKRLFGLIPAARGSCVPGGGIYSADAHSRTYAHLRETAAMLLRTGWSVIVDAVFLKRADRDAFQALAHEVGAGFGILAPQASPEQQRQRIKARAAAGLDASEATLEVLALQMQVLEPLGHDELALRVGT